VMYYIAIITSVMMPQDDPGETECPCLRAGCHNQSAVQTHEWLLSRG
jgi:hypothetical protein